MRLRIALSTLFLKCNIGSRTSAGVTVERDTIVHRALDAFEAGTADFSDYFIHESSREAGALPVLTFDKNFARESGVELVPEA
jgi:predicted nucleic-acid-binding protein